MLVRIVYLLVVSFLFFACNSEQKPTVNTIENKTIEGDTNSIQHFIQKTKTASPAEVIPQYFCQKYIQAAMNQQVIYPYGTQESSSYAYGKIVYENEDWVALSFYYKHNNNNNQLSGSFLATYLLSNGQCIDFKQLFGSSVFVIEKEQDAIGISYQTDIEYVKNPAIILRLHSIEKQTSNYNKAPNEQRTVRLKNSYDLNKLGKFEPKENK